MKNTFKLCALVLFSTLALTGCMPSDTKALEEKDIELLQLKEPQEGQEIAIIKTNIGDITMMLFEEEAPETVAHFKKLIADGFFIDKPIFTENEINSFITGAVDTPATQGKLLTEDGKPIQCEITPNLWHFSGAVSVLGYEKNIFTKELISDSRFFVLGDEEPTTELVTEMEEFEYPLKVINAYKEIGGKPEFTGYYTVFGHVIDGMDLVNEISQYKNPSTEEALPIEEVIINSIELSKYTKE